MTAGLAICISGLISFLVYDSLWGMCSMPFVFYPVGRILKEKREKKMKRRLDLEFKDYMCAVSGLLAAGNSVEQAFIRAILDVRQLYGEESVLAGRLERMERRLSLKEPIERILMDFAEESSSEDIENFAEIFCYAKRGGGDFLHIIATSVKRICDKAEVLEEIHTMTAQKALEQKVMCAAPLGILLFFKVSSPEFIGMLYGNLLGICIMTAALLLYAAAFWIGQKIVEVEV